MSVMQILSSLITTTPSKSGTVTSNKTPNDESSFNAILQTHIQHNEQNQAHPSSINNTNVNNNIENSANNISNNTTTLLKSTEIKDIRVSTESTDTQPNNTVLTPQQDLLAMMMSMQIQPNIAPKIVPKSDTAINTEANPVPLKSTTLGPTDTRHQATPLETSTISQDTGINNTEANAVPLKSTTLSPTDTRHQATPLETSTISQATGINNTEANAVPLKSTTLSPTDTRNEATSLETNTISQATGINNPEGLLTQPSTTVAPALNTPPPLTAIPTYPIAPPVNQTGWNEAISQRVVWMTSQNIQSATLNISPENLGPVQVQIQLENQQANVQFFSAHADVRLALQNSIPLLNQMLEQTGIQLGQSDVSSQNSGTPQQPKYSNAQSQPNTALSIDLTNTPITSSLTHSIGTGLLNIYA